MRGILDGPVGDKAQELGEELDLGLNGGRTGLFVLVGDGSGRVLADDGVLEVLGDYLGCDPGGERRGWDVYGDARCGVVEDEGAHRRCGREEGGHDSPVLAGRKEMEE